MSGGTQPAVTNLALVASGFGGRGGRKGADRKKKNKGGKGGITISSVVRPDSAGTAGRSGTGKGSGRPKLSPEQKAALRKKILRECRPVRLSKDEDDPNEFILSRFVINPYGQQLGESIGVDGDDLIMKKGPKFYSIPLKFIRDRSPDLVLVKKVDWAKALALGEKWKKSTLELPDPKPLFERTGGPSKTPAAKGVKVPVKKDTSENSGVPARKDRKPKAKAGAGVSKGKTGAGVPKGKSGAGGSKKKE